MHIPKAHGIVFTGADEAVAIRYESQRPYAISMSLQHLETFARADVPESNGLIVAAAGKSAAIAS